MASDKKAEKIKLIMGAVTMDTRTFQIVTPDDAAEQVDLPSGHATVVRKMETLTGDVVVKEINKKTGKFNVTEAEREVWWLNAQKKAKVNSEKIREKGSSVYFVPKTYVSHGKVREEFVSGNRWRDVFKGLSDQDKIWAFKAVAEFINDMSELYPIKYDDKVRSVPFIPIKGPEALAKGLETLDEKYISKEDKQLIQEIYEYLSSVPENRVLVWGHNDLHPDNIIIDLEKRQIGIIDFELSGYGSAFCSMYRGMMDSPDFWDYVNKLPRSKNPDFSWNFVSEHRDLHRFLRWAYKEVVESGQSLESVSDKLRAECERIRYVFARAKIKSNTPAEKQKMPLVPMSHYEKD